MTDERDIDAIASVRRRPKLVTVGVNNRIRIHRLIAEKTLGRKLPSGAEVHHVDGNPLNNQPSNLVICQNHDYHMLLHVRARVVKLGGDPNFQFVCCACKKLQPFKDSYTAKVTTGSRKAGSRLNICRDCARAKGKANWAARPKLPPQSRKRTHCQRGHDLSITGRRICRNRRECAECARARQNKYNFKRRHGVAS